MNLESIQRAMAAAVMQPLTEEEGMREQAPDGRAMTEVAASFIAPNSRLTAFERLEIYNRQYWFRVLSALGEDFPALRAVIGSAQFDALSVAYLAAHPSRSFTLRNLGSKLVEWLAAHPEFTGRRHALAIDVARIEWAFVEAFDSADRAPLTLSQIAALDGASHLVLQPHLQLMALDYPADNLVLSLHQREKRQTSEAGVGHEEESTTPIQLPRLRRRPTWLAAHRVEYSVYYRRLAREEFLVLSSLREGQLLGQALEAAFADSTVPETRRGASVQTWFGTWAELGWICAAEN
ncbi:MAG TPA: DNA-binding domain-containing protein [Terracidiphilus sp.]|nr:DNA-binding domain-containing protein [Terracidiphilus sp.]